jgi:broad specificity phosphatase PhoE
MAVYLVRHAVAQSRSEWGHKDDELRPLTKRGERQADGLVALVNGADVRRVVSSPAVRCVDTVGPVAGKLGLDVKVDDALAEGAGGKSASDLARRLATSKGDTILCTHGDIVPEVLRRVARDGAEMPEELRWAKGSTWVLETDGDHFTRASYLPPPD